MPVEQRLVLIELLIPLEGQPVLEPRHRSDGRVTS